MLSMGLNFERINELKNLSIKNHFFKDDGQIAKGWIFIRNIGMRK